MRSNKNKDEAEQQETKLVQQQDPKNDSPQDPQHEPQQDPVEELQEPKQPQLIYCGPNLAQGVLNQHSVYIGGLPKHIAAQVETCPAIGRLFVPVDELTHTQRAIQEAGTPEHIWYGQITRYMEGGDSE